MTPHIRIAYAANRAIGLRALTLLRDAGIEPVALLIPAAPRADATVEMKAALPDAMLVEGETFRAPEAIARLRALQLDYILSVHFPYLFPAAVLALPKIGTLNLHPALLPFNRGWHTPSWAIIERAPIGATLHWVDTGVDSGDIALQRPIDVRPDDTAHTLYQRLLSLELQLLAEAIPLLQAGRLPRRPQPPGGSLHRRADLAPMQRLDSERRMRVADLLDVLRGLTTSDANEAAFFEIEGRRYRVRVQIEEQPADAHDER